MSKKKVKFTKIQLGTLVNINRYNLEKPDYYIADSEGNAFLYLDQLMLLRDNILKLLNRNKVSSLELATTLDLDISQLHDIFVSMRNHYPQDIVEMLASYFSVNSFELLYSLTEKKYKKLNKKAKKIAIKEFTKVLKEKRSKSKDKTKKRKNKKNGRKDKKITKKKTTIDK